VKSQATVLMLLHVSEDLSCECLWRNLRSAARYIRWRIACSKKT